MQVLTQHYDSARTGANLQETVLSPANVAPDRFGKLFELAVQGQVYAQPLFVQGVSFPGAGQRNALYVATRHNQVSAFDADAGGSPLWSRSLGPFVSLPDANIGPGGYQDIADAVGSYGDRDPYHGWVFGFDAGTLRQRPSILITTRFGDRGGIWMAGQGPAADAAGSVYLMTGNGTFAQTTIANKVVLGETAVGHPALVNHNGQLLVIGWTSADTQQHVNIIQTTSGSSFTGKVTLGETSIDGPALASGNGRLFLAWTGTDGAHSLNVSSSTDLRRSCHWPTGSAPGTPRFSTRPTRISARAARWCCPALV